MKVKSLCILVGVGAPLVLTRSVGGAFVGVHAIAKPNEFGILVCNVYADFDRPGEDQMIAVAGTPDTPLSVSVIGGTFYQHAFGSDTPPLAILVQIFPSLAYDTFVTIGVKKLGDPGGQPQDDLILTALWPGFGESTFGGDKLGWVLIEGDPQADPFNPDFVAGDGNVLIAQFSTADGIGFEGEGLIQVISNGQLVLEPFSFHFPLPIPCPWDCDGSNESADGNVGVDDFLTLLAQWGQVGTSCDFDEAGVGILDFLELLAHWGPCP